MSNTVTATVTSTQQTFPKDPGIKSFQFVIVDSSGNPTVTAQGFPTIPATVTFMNVPAGAGLQVKGYAADWGGGVIGTPVFSSPFDASAVTLTVVGTITVVVS